MLHQTPTVADTLSFSASTVSMNGAREYQEDSLISCFSRGHDFGYAVIADGMGGHGSGDVASALVVTEVFSQIKMNERKLHDGFLDVSAVLRASAEAANTRVAAHIKDDAETEGMGSTLLAVLVRSNRLYWVSVGDSPLYLFRDGALRRLNKDHSMAPEIDLMVKSGSLTPEMGRDHPDRSILNAAITGKAIQMIDCPKRPVVLLPDDVLIAGSDGLQSLSNATLAKAIKQNQAQDSGDIAEALMAALADLADPGQDNATFVVLKLGIATEEGGMAVDLADMPILATAEDEDGDGAGEAPQDSRPAEAAAPAADPNAGRKAYWYRGQKYFKD